MKLHLYFARRFLTSFLMILGIFGGIILLLDMVETIRKFAGLSLSLTNIFGLTLLNLPTALYRILPLITIFATLMLFLGLARSSELVVTRAAGRSAMRSLIAPVVAALLIGLLALAAFNPIVAATSKQYEARSDALRGNTSSVLSISREGLWLRQSGQDGPVVIRAAESNLDGTRLRGVTFLGFGITGLPVYRIEGTSAELITGAWQITGAKRWTLGTDVTPEQTAEYFDTLTLPSDLTREQIRDSFGTPSSIPIWELPGFITQLERAGFSARVHKVWMQTELATPLTLIAMVLIGAGLSMRHTRFGHTGLLVLLAILFGFAVFFLRNFAQILGENGQIPIWLAAWAPPLSAILLTLGLVLHLEDG